MGKIFLNGVDYSATAINDVTGIKGNAENTYRKGNVNLTPEDIGALPVNGNATSASNAAKLDNKGIGHWNAIPQIDSEGVMEVGKYIDFHSSPEPEADYDVRLEHFLDDGDREAIEMYSNKFSGNNIGLCVGKNYDGITTQRGGWMCFFDRKLSKYSFRGTADQANCDGLGNNIADTYLKKTDSLADNYLPLSGGTFRDDAFIRFNTNAGIGTGISMQSDDFHSCIYPAEFSLYKGAGTNVGGVIRPDVISVFNGSNKTELKTDGVYINGTKLTQGLTSLPSHTHDDRYYTETEIDNMFKSQLAAIPTGLGNIKTGTFKYDVKPGVEISKIFFESSENSPQLRSMILLASIYVNCANTVDRYVSNFREITVKFLDHTEIGTNEWAQLKSFKIFSEHNPTQSVNVNTGKWYGMMPTEISCKLKFEMPAITAAKAKSGVLYVSWALIM